MTYCCNTCKKHYTQGGTCDARANNCLFYENEPRGKVVRSVFGFELDKHAITPLIKPRSHIIIADRGKDIDMVVTKINWIDMEKGTCEIEAEYHENEAPHCERAKLFRVVKN